jgi:hypothetical protein
MATCVTTRTSVQEALHKLNNSHNNEFTRKVNESAACLLYNWRESGIKQRNSLQGACGVCFCFCYMLICDLQLIIHVFPSFIKFNICIQYHIFKVPMRLTCSSASLENGVGMIQIQPNHSCSCASR